MWHHAPAAVHKVGETPVAEGLLQPGARGGPEAPARGVRPAAAELLTGPARGGGAEAVPRALPLWQPHPPGPLLPGCLRGLPEAAALLPRADAGALRGEGPAPEPGAAVLEAGDAGDDGQALEALEVAEGEATAAPCGAADFMVEAEGAPRLAACAAGSCVLVRALGPGGVWLLGIVESVFLP
eukprot:CAMPEP_0168486048 /NCGR_PEP_ID=MMETSP0228-20121227/66923_1 /TAXON_ID=133427 /ORGANISM="Protoceratium reticulatum, Strain CCCM 535 (=CCMP 1889)" /LENGTH=182 /DNA_ID=CAMNT_0008502629 /DNA_START=44 /DNA_END=591 /DNA_ORIENTATION=+